MCCTLIYTSGTTGPPKVRPFIGMGVCVGVYYMGVLYMYMCVCMVACVSID